MNRESLIKYLDTQYKFEESRTSKLDRVMVYYEDEDNCYELEYDNISLRTLNVKPLGYLMDRIVEAFDCGETPRLRMFDSVWILMVPETTGILEDGILFQRLEE